MNKDGSITIVNPAVNPNRIIAETDNCISNYVPLAALTVAQHYKENGTESSHANLICRNMNVIPNFSFMIGLPTETIDEMKQIMTFILSLKKDNPIFHYTPQQPFRPYPGSQLYSDLKEQGMIEEPKTTSEWIGFNYDNYMPWLDNKTYEFMRNLTFYSSKMSYVGRTVYGKILNKISIARGRMGIYSVPIERRMVSWTTQ